MMLNSIVHIESSDKTNTSFGTGFVIDKDDYGAYILTCEHVVAEVQTPTVNDQAGEIVATSEFLDMAVLHVKGLALQPLRLQIKECYENNVHAIGFSRFSQDLVQKREIQATLFDEIIEMHSKENDAFYLVRRLKADEDYRFDKGNSGSPLICEATGQVVAMISHREKDRYAYAIEIASLKEIWRDLNHELILEGELHSHQHFYDNINAFSQKIEANLQTRKKSFVQHSRQLHNMDELKQEIEALKEKVSSKSKLRYFFFGMVSVVLLFTAYTLFTQPKAYQAENYRVVNVSQNDVLNIREDKGTIYPVVGTIPFDSNNVAVTLCEANDAGQEWCQVTYGSAKGWVRAKYIEKEEENFENTDNEDTTHFKSIHDDLLLHFTYTHSVKPGGIILISGLLQNNGTSEKQGSITLSFPQRPILDWRVDYNDFEQIKQYRVFDEIYNNHQNQEKVMSAIHPLIEASSFNWDSNEEHLFALSIVAPTDSPILRIRVRASLTPQRTVPEQGVMDQQAFQSKEIIIRIEE